MKANLLVVGVAMLSAINLKIIFFNGGLFHDFYGSFAKDDFAFLFTYLPQPVPVLFLHKSIF